jgi:hypothetical protein
MTPNKFIFLLLSDFFLIIMCCLSPLNNSAPKFNNSNINQYLSIYIGDTFDIKLQTIGPGEYEQPIIFNNFVRFLGDSLVRPCIPAGPTQLYIFIADTTGQAYIAIPHSCKKDTFKIKCEIQNR